MQAQYPHLKVSEKARGKALGACYQLLLRKYHERQTDVYALSKANMIATNHDIETQRGLNSTSTAN